MTRLGANCLASVPKDVQTPGYDRANCGVGIVHLGLGAFHRAHQAFCTEIAMAAGGGDWKIIGVSMRNEQIAADLNDQDGLYTLIVKGSGTPKVQIIGSIARALCARTQADKVLEALSDPAVRIVTTTVTEKGYGIDRATGGVDPSLPIIARDIAGEGAPEGVIGLLVAALAERRARGIASFTVLCCDNLPDNGAFVRGGLIDFAKRRDAALGRWIAANVACPSSMVDRITPAQTPATRDLARALTGAEDVLAIETEPFSQWVIEDHFPTGRPQWEAAGVIFAADVAPFEKMKLRLLNGSHSLIAYMGALLGKKYVRDVMDDPKLEALVGRHLEAACATLPSMPNMDLAQYRADLIERFRNPNIAHQTCQIAADGSEKMPQRIFAPALDALRADQPLRPFAFATALWIWFCRDDDSQSCQLNDPRAQHLKKAARQATPHMIFAEFEKIAGMLPKELASSSVWRAEVLSVLTELTHRPAQQVIQAESEKFG
jgi:fructuronate reductase